jgi:hypothetical protein
MTQFETNRLALRAGLLMLMIGTLVFTSSTVFAKKVQYRKTQDVNFDAMDVDGVARSPDGAYLVQKRGIDFIPLYKVRKNFDENIKESVEYVK